MSLLTDYFAAPDDATAAGVLDIAGGPAAAPQGWPTIRLVGLEPVVTMGALEQFLTRRPYQSVVDNPRQGRVLADRGEAMVVTVTDELRAALAAADRSALTEVADVWAACEELDSSDPIAMAEALIALAGLCRGAQTRGEPVYCWLSA
jgi:hypothetical protein